MENNKNNNHKSETIQSNTDDSKYSLLDPTFKSPIIFNYESFNMMNYSFAQCKIPLIFSMQVGNNCVEDIKNIKVSINFEFDFIESTEIIIDKIESGKVYDNIPTLTIHSRKLFELSDTITDTMKIKCSLENGDVIFEETRELPILPMNYWAGVTIFPESISTFVMPNIPDVTRIVTRAKEILKKNTGESAFNGYLSNDKNVVRKQLAAIYGAIYEEKISYNLIQPSFEEVGQRVRTPQEVIKNKMGNCIEMACLFSSVAEACGLNPIIVCIKGHAFAGAWLEENLFDTNSVYDHSELGKRIAFGINDIEVVETTSLNEGTNKTYEQAVRNAIGSLDNADDFLVAIDVKRSHYSGIRPLPIKIVENDEVKIIDCGLPEDATDKAEVTKTIEEYFIDTSTQDEVDKRKIWMKNLLDLTKRNTLISFRTGPRTLQLFNSDLSMLEDALSNGSSFDIKEVVSDWKGISKNVNIVDVESEKEFISEISKAEFKLNRIRTFLSKDELSQVLKGMYRDAKKSTEESGASTLFLALGFLKWLDPLERNSDGEIPFRYAPLVLLPVELKRKSNNSYQLQLRSEDPQMNITILEMLKQKFNLKINGLSPLPQDQSGIDLKLILNSIRKAIMHMNGWDVEEIAFLGHFSFSQFVLWNDLNSRFDKLKENKVVQALVEGRYKDERDKIFEANELDLKHKVLDIAIPTSVDSSQLMSIIEADSDSSFVLHGPPGTGKSQTITNMIANALYHGKSVLFVAEKMAALNVVYDRLSEIGLGDFCLEIHSNKTQKNVVLEKLNNNLQLKKSTSDDTFIRTANRLTELKRSIADQVEELHKVRPQGYSVYNLINELQRFKKASFDLEFNEQFIEKLNRINWEELEFKLSNLIKAGNSIDIKGHPLNDFRKVNFNLDKTSEVKNKLDSAIGLIGKIQDYESSRVESNDIFNRIINEDAYKNTYIELNKVVESRNLKTVVNYDLWKILLDSDTSKYFEESNKIYDRLKNQEEYIKSRYSSEIDSFDASDAKSKFITAKSALIFKGKKIREALIGLNSLVKSGDLVAEATALDELTKIISYQDAQKEYSKSINELSKVLKTDLSLEVDINDSVNDLFEFSKYIKTNKLISKDEIFKVYKFTNDLTDEENDALNNYINSGNELASLLKEISIYTGVDFSVYTEREDKIRLKSDLSLWSDNIEQWKSWSVFYENISFFNELKLSNVSEKLFEKVIKENYDINSFYNDFNYNLFRSVLLYHMKKSEILSKFNSINEDAKIEEYNKLVTKFENLTKAEIKVRLSQNLPDLRTCDDKEAKQISNINRIIQSKGRGTSIRQMFDNNSVVIKKLTPCFLMSPLSVAQYIDVDFPKFDLVIFDEASQIRTSFAIGAMSRAKNCIIVGDPNQMPPTSFFSAQKLDEDNIQIEDLESLLEDCLAVNMPQKYLTCHYRSQSESLITFSNSMYYNNKMITFPSPADKSSSVKFNFVNGTYDRGKTRTNLEEAKKIVEEIKNRLLNGDAEKNSIGVITFNTSQQYLIDDLLQKEFSKNEKLEKIANSLKEPIFIKNLENVQGDERDVILFSISFGKDKEGKFYQNFGPIAKKGGWRRLNVAVSRARKEMIVFSSIMPEDIGLTSYSSEGVRGLKKFLEYAQKGVRITNKVATEKETPVIKSICEFLKNQGYEIDTNVGNSNLKLQIAVIDKNFKDEYFATILLDDDSYAKQNTVRDKVRMIPGVLTRMGWSYFRVWSLEWFENEEKVKKDLLSFLNQAKLKFNKLKEEQANKQVELSQTQQKDEFDSDIKDVTEQEKTVNKSKFEAHDKVDLKINDSSNGASGEEILTNNDVIQKKSVDSLEVLNTNSSGMFNINSLESEKLNTGNKVIREDSINQVDLSVNKTEGSNIQKDIVEKSYVKYIFEGSLTREDFDNDIMQATKFIDEILAIEAPIIDNYLYRRVSEIYGNMKVTKPVKEKLDLILKKSKKTKQGDSLVYWGNLNQSEYFEYRTNSDRMMQEISDYEIGNCLYETICENVINNEVIIGEEDLFKIASKKLGYSRVTSKVTSQFNDVITSLIRRKLIKRKGKTFELNVEGDN